MYYLSKRETQVKPRVVLDTNLALLLAVGAYDLGFISKHKRTRAFDEKDFHLLDELLAKSQIIFTTSILTETSNLSRHVTPPARDAISLILREIIYKLGEFPLESNVAAGHSDFIRLGLTDAGILEVASKEKAAIVTDDLDLYLAALSSGLDVVNFTHLRAQRRDFR